MNVQLQPLTDRRRAVVFAITFIGPVALLGALSSTAQEKPPPANETAAQYSGFKNIKVLKKLPAAGLIPLMRRYNAALGVGCSYCHVIGANHTGFEKDDKPEKATARKMILMVEDLNRRQESVKGKANCYMCHHGHSQPEPEPERSEGDRPSR